MGGGNSTLSDTNTVVNSISTTIIQSLQVTESQVRQRQSFNMDCTCYESIVEQSISDCESKFAGRSAADIATICALNSAAFPPCGANGVDLTQSLTADSTNGQKISDVTSQTSNLSTTVQKNLSQTYGIGQFDNTLSSKTSSVMNSISTLISMQIQCINDKISQIQSITLTGGELKMYNANQVADVISQTIQGDTATMSQVSDLSTDINEAISQKENAFNLQVGLIIGAVVFVIVIIIVLRLIFANHAKNSE